MDYRRIKAIEANNKKRIKAVNPDIPESSGIYFLIREDENTIKYAYIGQAKHLLTRLAQHLSGYQHIDLSLKKHGLYSEENEYGWKIGFICCQESELDDKEKYYIQQYAAAGYQLRNKTAGGQSAGKTQIDEYRPTKGYRDGLEQGYKNASKEVAHLFEKHLNYSIKSDKPNKIQEKAKQKFEDFLNYSKVGGEDGKEE